MPKRLGPNRLGAEMTECRCGCRKDSCPSDYLALNLLGCEYSYSVIFAIIVLSYTGAGDEFFTLPSEINNVAFQPFNIVK